jgi:decaprenylphospho-beta-D-erythro-pentofuranosid-2-ulose 2-reductase
MKSILIIGGNSDIGFELSKQFILNKYKILLASRNLKQLKIKKRILKKLNVDCEIFYFDIQQIKNHHRFLEKLNLDIEILIISCGYLEKKEKNFNKVISINYMSIVSFVETFLSNKKYFNNVRSIIGISSLAGERGKERLNVYSSAKAGFSNYLDGLRQKLFKKNKLVFTVKLGFVKTKMTRNLKLNSFLTMTPEKIAKKIFKDFKKKNSRFIHLLCGKLLLVFIK